MKKKYSKSKRKILTTSFLLTVTKPAEITIELPGEGWGFRVAEMSEVFGTAVVTSPDYRKIKVTGIKKGDK